MERCCENCIYGKEEVCEESNCWYPSLNGFKSEIDKEREYNELLEEKRHYEYMIEQYSKGEEHFLKEFIIKDSERNLIRINEELSELSS